MATTARRAHRRRGRTRPPRRRRSRQAPRSAGARRVARGDRRLGRLRDPGRGQRLRLADGDDRLDPQRSRAQLGILAVAVALLMIAGRVRPVGRLDDRRLRRWPSLIAVTPVDAGWSGWSLLTAASSRSRWRWRSGSSTGGWSSSRQLPSFIVTLGTLFIIRGVTIAITRLRHGPHPGRRPAEDVPGFDIRSRRVRPKISRSSALASASRSCGGSCWRPSRPGSCCARGSATGSSPSGGNAEAARNVGVPVRRVKILLFMHDGRSPPGLSRMIAGDAVHRQRRRAARRAARVLRHHRGGDRRVLLTGGYGSAIGAVLGALIYGMVQQGIVFAGIDADWVPGRLGRDAAGRGAGQPLRPPARWKAAMTRIDDHERSRDATDRGQERSRSTSARVIALKDISMTRTRRGGARACSATTARASRR